MAREMKNKEYIGKRFLNIVRLNALERATASLNFEIYYHIFYTFNWTLNDKPAFFKIWIHSYYLTIIFLTFLTGLFSFLRWGIPKRWSMERHWHLFGMGSIHGQSRWSYHRCSWHLQRILGPKKYPWIDAPSSSECRSHPLVRQLTRFGL